MKATKYLSILAIAAFFSACTKTGPEGPQGAPGANGVSDLTTSGYSIGSGSWNYSVSANQYYVNTGQSIPLSDAAVVYYSVNSGNSYSPLPASSVFATSDYLTFSYGQGLTLWYTPNPSASIPGAVLINVVDIPPSLQNKYPNTNWQNASEVAGIPEVRAALNNANNK